MECPSCGINNMPGSIRCYDCKFKFNPQSDFFNPIYTKSEQKSVFQNWLELLPLPAQFINNVFQSIILRTLILPLIWIPGIAQWSMDHYERGLALLLLTIIPLMLGFTLFNHWISNIFIPLGLLIYLWALIDGFYLWRERHYPVIPSLQNRIITMGFITVGIIIIGLIWAPDIRFIQVYQSGFAPAIHQGDHLILNPRPGKIRTYNRRDLVAIQYANSTTFARLIAFSNEQIYLYRNQFYHRGLHLDIGLESMIPLGANQRIDIPPNSYLLLMGLHGPNLTLYTDWVIVPAHLVMGRIEFVVSPTANRKRLL